MVVKEEPIVEPMAAKEEPTIVKEEREREIRGFSISFPLTHTNDESLDLLSLRSSINLKNLSQ